MDIRRYIALALVVFMITGLLTGCVKNDPPVPPDDADPVTLTVAGGWTECKALDDAARAFTAKYPNCTIVYEYLQDYYVSTEKRLASNENIDLFFTTNVQDDSTLLPYVLDLKSCEGLDLSKTFDGLIENFTFREKSDGTPRLYSIPLGAEMRGLYVNKTLLASLGLGVPKNQAELLAACAKLKENGYIPFHGNPGAFAQTLMYPWICNVIANADNYEEIYSKVNSREAGISELFREPYEFLYTLVENRYYDYKKAQTDLDIFNDTTDEAHAQYFLNIKKQDGVWGKTDDLGQIAFMPAPMSLQSTIDIHFLNNSVTYTKAGGAVTLRVFEEPRQGDKARVCFIVADTGISHI